MNEEQLFETQRSQETVHYMIRGHGAMTGQLINIFDVTVAASDVVAAAAAAAGHRPRPLPRTIVTTYTKVGDTLTAAVPETDIAVCNLSDKDYDDTPFIKNDYGRIFPDMEMNSWNNDDDVNHPAGVYMCVPGLSRHPYVLIEKLIPDINDYKRLSEYIPMIYNFHTNIKKLEGNIKIHLLACLGYRNDEFEEIKESYMYAANFRNQAARQLQVLKQNMALLKGEMSVGNRVNKNELRKKISIQQDEIKEHLEDMNEEMKEANEKSYNALRKQLLIVASKDSTNYIAQSQDQIDFENAAAAANYINSPQILKDINAKDESLRKQQEALLAQQERFAVEQRQRLGLFLEMVDNLDNAGTIDVSPGLVPLPHVLDQSGGPAGAWGGRGGKKKRTTKKTRKIKQKKRRKTIRKRKKRTVRRRKRGGRWKTRHKYQNRLKKEKKKVAEKGGVKMGTINPAYVPNPFGPDGEFPMTK